MSDRATAYNSEAEKALFVPLMTQWFRAFERRQKRAEYRIYGPRWNEKMCRVGRRVVLAHGYGWPRLTGIVTGFNILSWDKAPTSAQAIFPSAIHIAEIEIGEIQSMERP